MTASEYGTVDRRRLLEVIGASTTAAFAGCMSDDAEGDEGSESETGRADSDPEPVSVEADATWRIAPLTDVTTGDEFRIDDFDRPVVVHTFARGCAACHSQQREFAEFFSAAEGDVEIVDLTIDPNDDPDDIRAYAETDDFGWRFGPSPERVTGSLVDTFGQEVTVSAASPVIIACPDGETYRLDKVIDAGELDSAIAESC